MDTLSCVRPFDNPFLVLLGGWCHADHRGYGCVAACRHAPNDWDLKGVVSAAGRNVVCTIDVPRKKLTPREKDAKNMADT